MEKTITTLPLEDVFPNPKHYREVKPENVKRIAASIAEAGQLVPIEVWRDGDIYIIDQGHHRVAAMKELEHTSVEAIISEGESTVSMVASNLSVPETDLEKSRGTQLMLSLGIRPEAVAAHVGEKPERVEKAARALTIAKEAAEDMTIDRLIAISEFEDDPEAAEAILSATEESWNYIYQIHLRRRKDAERQAQLHQVALDSGLEIVEKIDYATMTILYGSDAPAEAQSVFIADGYLVWLAPKVNTTAKEPTPEEIAEEERKLVAKVALDSARASRMKFLRDYFDGHVMFAGGDHLAALMNQLWEEGVEVSIYRIADELQGLKQFLHQVRAAIVSDIDIDCDNALRAQAGLTFAFDDDKSLAIRYQAALRAIGYATSDIERDLMNELENERLDGEGDE